MTSIPGAEASTKNNSPDLFANKYASAFLPSIKKRLLPDNFPFKNSIPASSLAPTYSDKPTPTTHSPPAIFGNH